MAGWSWFALCPASDKDNNMLRTIDTVERNIVDTGIAAITVPDSQSTLVVPNSQNDPSEVAYIQLFNAGGNKAYISYGRAADNLSNFNFFLFPGSSVDIKHRIDVYCFSVGGTQISVTILRRVQSISNRQ